MFNKILAYVAGKIYFREITACEGFDFLKDYYRKPILFLNERVLEYTNAETPEGMNWRHISFNVDDDD